MEKKILEITDLLGYWPMLEIFGGHVLEQDNFNQFFQRAWTDSVYNIVITYFKIYLIYILC